MFVAPYIGWVFLASEEILPSPRTSREQIFPSISVLIFPFHSLAPLQIMAYYRRKITLSIDFLLITG